MTIIVGSCLAISRSRSSPDLRSPDPINTSISALLSSTPRLMSSTRIGSRLDGNFLSLKGAPHERDYLLPAPSNNFRGFKTKELRYATAFATQSQVISLASYRGLRIFQGSTGHYHTPHSGRNFMPSGAAALGFSKADRDVLGGWSAEGSERYTRTAKFKIAQMQSAIAATFRNPDVGQLGEADDVDDLGDFLRTWEVAEKSILRTKKILCALVQSRILRESFRLSFPQ